MHPLKRVQIAHLKADKAFTKVSREYANFVKIFLPKLAAKFSKYIKINNHAIKLKDD